jgi:fluoroacetyl-CoA thioesterase
VSDSPSEKIGEKLHDKIHEKIKVGMEGSVERVVLPEWTLSYYQPHLPAVFSTPAMIGLMEMAASSAVRHHLAPESMAVGTRIEVEHIKAVPAGVPVVAKAKLVEIENRQMVFEVNVWQGEVLVGRGRIRHRIVQQSRFRAIAAEKPSKD